ncbi:MAG: tetratricopeptide repeat protein [Cyanobacteria bacterium P01_H01_bin.58]
MARAAKLLGFAVLSVLLVPAIQIFGSLQPLNAAQSGERRQIPEGLGAGQLFLPTTTRESWNLDLLDGKEQKAGLPLPPAPRGLGKVASLPPQAGLKQAGTANLLDVEGQLENGDEVLQDGSLYDLHTFEGEAGQFIEIRLSSDAFDTYLTLVGPDGERVAENDDGGEGLNSIIYIQLPQTGRYSVIANAYDAAERGRYRLTVTAISAEEYQRGQEIASANAEADQLLQQGIQQYNRSQFREALAFWQQALELYRAAEDRAGESRALNNLGVAYKSLGQYERAIDFYEQDLEITRELSDLAGEGVTLGNLSNTYNRLGQYERAIDLYAQALAIFRSLGSRAEEGSVLGNLGTVYENLGQYERAIDLYEQDLAIAREIGNYTGESITLGNLGNTYNRLGQYERTIDLYEQALEIARDVGDRVGEGRTLGNLGIVYNDLGQYERAIDFHEQALLLFRELGSRAEEGSVLGNLGTVYENLGRYERAIDFYEHSLEIAREISNRAGESHALGNLGNAHESLGQYERAIDFHEQALVLFRELGSRAEEGNILGNLGNVYNDLGQYARAIDLYEQSLEIAREIDDRAGEGYALNNLGVVYDNLGQYERAIDFHEQSLEIAREIGGRADEGRALNNLGTVYESLGQYERAIDLYEQSLEIAREISNRTGEGHALNNLGNAYESLGQYERAIDLYEQSLEIAREIGDRTREGGALSNLGTVYESLGQYERTIDLYEQHFAISREIGDRAGEGRALNNLGIIYESLGQYEQAIDFYEQSLEIAREIGNRAGEGRALGNLGSVYDSLGQYECAINLYEQNLEIAREIGNRDSEGTALGNLGVTYANLGQYERAIDSYEHRLEIAREIGDRAGEGSAIGNLGVAYSSLSQDDRALEQYGQAVALFDELGARADEAVFLSNIGRLLNRQAQPELAITFLKANVDIRESIRGEIRQLDRDLQQTFTDTIAADYRLLAELLLQSDRVLEAQEILDLLKLQELDDYELRNVRSDEETNLAFWPAEQEILDSFYAALQDETDLQTFFASGEVTDQVAQLQRNARGQNLNPEQLAKLQDNLQQAGNAALLYPLILDDRLELLLVTTSGLVRRTVSLDRVELNRLIAEFRTDITNRSRDPRPNAQQLYDWLIAPLVADLDEAEAETILYAADGQLRYIPLAALHDGDQWLTDRFTINHITAASLTDFSPAEAQPLSILAGAFPAQDLLIEVAGEERWFNGLPFAELEVENLQANLPGTQAFFSAGFNRQAIEPRLPNHSIIHLATHGTFRSGHPNDSFILLGDGDRITLFDLDQWELPNAALVVLSACETAVSGPGLGTGEEILGFGYQIQRTGARAAIASLWIVSDGGTQTLMDAFYLALQNGFPKAEALRRSQQALISDDLNPVGGEGRVRAGAPPVPRNGAVQNEAYPGYSHPYYWAPFILIGNGL